MIAEQTQTQLDRLKRIRIDKGRQNLTSFQGLIGVHVGVPVEPYYPKQRGFDGKPLKDKDGKDLRSEIPDGEKVVLSEWGTGKKIVCIMQVSEHLEELTAYRISGLGYDMSKAGMIFLSEDVEIEEY